VSAAVAARRVEAAARNVANPARAKAICTPFKNEEPELALASMPAAYAVPGFAQELTTWPESANMLRMI
jgi:hypothetical protein